MKKVVISCFTILFICQGICGQTLINQKDNIVNFEAIVNHFNLQIPSQDTIKLPFIYKGEYSVAISNKPIAFDTKEIVLNPANDEFPVSFSIIYQDKLISLFGSGSFVCYSIPSMDRDKNFEKILNTKKFQYHWLLDNKLVGLSKGSYYYFDSNNKWVKYSETIPMKQQAKLFEDDSYISFRDCHGEWGGTVYFYDKISKKTYFTEATCANSVIKRGDSYFVLSELGHMMGKTTLKEISNPDQLSLTELKNINRTVKGEALGYTDKSDKVKTIFDFYDIQMFSSFVYQGRALYIVYWKETTFLAEIKGNDIEVVNPLLNRELYTHNPITNSYGDKILMNLDFYGIAREKEVSCIIIMDNQLIKVDWSEKHND